MIPDYEEEENAHALEGIVDDPEKKCTKCCVTVSFLMCLGSSVATLIIIFSNVFP